MTNPTPQLTAASLLAMIPGVADLRAEEMFGGQGLWQSGFMFGILYKDKVYLKVSGAAKDAHVAAGMGPFSPSPRITLHDFMEVPPGVVGDAGQFAEWAKRSIAG